MSDKARHQRRTRWISVLSLLLSAPCASGLAGCGDDEADGAAGQGGNVRAKVQLPGAKCSLSFESSGAVDAQVNGAVACDYYRVYDHRGVGLRYTPAGRSDLMIEIALGGLSAGELGTLESQAVQVGQLDSEGNASSWLAFPCTVEITRHDVIKEDPRGDIYVVEGHGTCDAPLTSEEAPGEATLAPFTFASTVHWTYLAVQDLESR